MAAHVFEALTEDFNRRQSSKVFLAEVVNRALLVLHAVSGRGCDSVECIESALGVIVKPTCLLCTPASSCEFTSESFSADGKLVAACDSRQALPLEVLCTGAFCGEVSTDGLEFSSCRWIRQ